jgi:ketosteroid isomerase-like protein
MTMKYISAVLLIGLLAAVPQGWAQAPGSAEQELIKRENAWSEATLKGDGAALQEIFADEYLDTDQDGVTWNKSQDVANVTSGAFKLASYKLDDLKVHVYGRAAVVTGLNTIKATFKGKDVSGAYRFTDVFVKRGGRWQCVATQGTLVAKK